MIVMFEHIVDKCWSWHITGMRIESNKMTYDTFIL
jgi:hypothetical protein